MPDIIFNSFKKNIMNGNINLAVDTIKVMLVTSSYVPDQDAHEFKSSVTNEVVGTNYTAGGAVLTGKTVSQDNTDNEGVFDANDVTWGNSTITAKGAIFYKDTGVAATSPLICYIDFGTTKISTNSDFVLQWNTEGILNLN